MIKKISFIALTLALAVSCVSPKVYKELEGKYANLKKENRKLYDDNETLLSAKNKAENSLKELQANYDAAVAKRDKLQSDYNALKANHDNLTASYDALEKNSSEAIADNVKRNRELLAQLEAKEQALANENARLTRLENDLKIVDQAMKGFLKA